MKVLFVNHVARLGGAERSLLDVLTALTGHLPPEHLGLYLMEEGPLADEAHALGVQVFVTPRPLRLIHVSRKDITTAPWRLLSLAGECRTVVADLRRTAQAFGATVLHANSAKAPPFALLAARGPGLPVVSHLRDLFPATTPVRWYLHWLVRRSTLVLTNSRAVAAQLPDSPKVQVLYNALDPAVLHREAANTTPAQIRQQWGLAGGDFPLVLVGRLQAWKGQHVAVDALPLLPASVKLLLVGSGIPGQSTEPALREQARRLGVADRVIFTGERGDVPALMAAAGAVLHTSTQPEPFGRVVLEAMLLGRPVIATGMGGPREIIDDGVTGVLVPPGDAHALATAITRLLEDPATAEAMGRAARQEATERFALDRLCRSLLDHYAALSEKG